MTFEQQFLFDGCMRKGAGVPSNIGVQGMLAVPGWTGGSV